MKADIDVTTTYPYPADRVWAALTSSEALSAWFMPNDFRPAVGTRLRMHQVGFDGLGAQLTRRILSGGYPRILGQRLPAYLGQTTAGPDAKPSATRCEEGGGHSLLAALRRTNR